MARARTTLLLGVTAWLAACTETTGPPASSPPLTRADGQLHQLRWNRPSAPRQFVALGDNLVLRSPQRGAAASTAFGDRDVSFWAYANQDQEIQVNYQAADGSWQPYVWFRVPQNGLRRRPDGQAFAEGDSVLITLAVDAISLRVTLEPTGLAFNSEAPAQLTVWYTGADPDFDANGVVDATDSYVEQDLLGVWVREFATDPWTRVTATQSIPNQWFSANLSHFSDYSVSY